MSTKQPNSSSTTTTIASVFPPITNCPVLPTDSSSDDQLLHLSQTNSIAVGTPNGITPAAVTLNADDSTRTMMTTSSSLTDLSQQQIGIPHSRTPIDFINLGLPNLAKPVIHNAFVGVGGNGLPVNSMTTGGPGNLFLGGPPQIKYINIDEILRDNFALREKLKELTAERDRLSCENSNLRLELDMAELKRLPEER